MTTYPLSIQNTLTPFPTKQCGAPHQALVSAEEEESLHRCGKAVETALDTYALISQQSVALNSKSGDSHLEDLDGALRLFKRLAELDFV